MTTWRPFVFHPSSIILFFCAAAGAAMVCLFDDSCQQDGGLHFLFAKWAWKHPELFVGVWSRPLFTFLYSFPALISYRAARILTVLICLATAWQTWRLAEDLKIERAPLAMALLWLQPSCFLFSADTMTEPLFALIFVIALRLYHQGYVKASMGVASLMILARPEGFFLGILWGGWVLSDLWKRNRNLNILHLPLLAGGFVLWWLAALLITRDPLYIKHNWPANWPVTGTVYGAAGLFAYPIRLPEIVGPFFLIPFVYGLSVLLKRRKLWTITSTFLLFFVLHTVLRAFGLLGSAGYPRYLVAISPAIAVITLIGWNNIARLFSHTSRTFRLFCAIIIIAISAYLNFVYADGAEWSRDARAIAQVHSWFQSHPQPLTRFIWSEPYSCILFDRDPWENPNFARNREGDLKLLRESPSGTLALWDEKVGPKWFGLKADDFQEAGFRMLYRQSFTLEGYILDRSWFGYGGPRHQVYYLLYKP
jgi:hypothetical protein